MNSRTGGGVARHYLELILIAISMQLNMVHIVKIVIDKFDSSFRFVYVWDTNSRRILYKLPGHDGSVNDVDFHPNELICK